MAYTRAVFVEELDGKKTFYPVPDDVLGFVVLGDFLHIPYAHVEYETRELRTWGTVNGEWFPANGGTETPFVSRSGIRMLYCWQPTTGKHAYLNCDTDIIMTDEEASAALAL